MKSDFYPFNITVASTDDKPCRSSFLAACERIVFPDSSWVNISYSVLSFPVFLPTSNTTYSGIPLLSMELKLSPECHPIENPTVSVSPESFPLTSFLFREDTLTLCVPPVAGTDIESVSMKKTYSHVITPAS